MQPQELVLFYKNNSVAGAIGDTFSPKPALTIYTNMSAYFCFVPSCLVVEPSFCYWKQYVCAK